MFDMWLKFQSKHSDPNWNTFCQEELQVDGYWEVNEIGHFTALDLNHCVIKIHVNGNLFFEGSYTELRNTYEDEDVLDSNFTNESSEYVIVVFVFINHIFNPFFNPGLIIDVFGQKQTTILRTFISEITI